MAKQKIESVRRYSNGAPRSRKDWCSQANARHLAEQIREFWRSKGYQVQVSVEAFTRNHHDTVYMVRSDMINGMPRTILPQAPIDPPSIVDLLDEPLRAKTLG